ncbi:hypothetical protein NDU88_000492 [Pleurodeles waltl]|uniref:Uncharacterized protein n=1 Tax=Pleurodeles waltl TaxID=8319 RepID=A0AAV7TFQ3_PLEWA|nr:hypothetical protein NDU88_000492 [Pleurodeles waltl]
MDLCIDICSQTLYLTLCLGGALTFTVVEDKSSCTAAQQKVDKQGVTMGEGGVAVGAPAVEDTSKTAMILQAIHDLKVTMEGKMGELKLDLALIHQDFRNAMHRITSVEGRLS